MKQLTYLMLIFLIGWFMVSTLAITAAIYDIQHNKGTQCQTITSEMQQTSSSVG